MDEESKPVEETTPRVPVGTVTFLFTDIEGSTKLVERLRDGYGQLQADHQRLLREAFAAAGGHEIDTQGDAFFVAFQRARDTVVGAVAAQRAIASHQWPAGTEVRIRMGIHTDEPGVAADRYHGVGVVRAARICSAGHGGQILVSGATRSLIDEDELPGLTLRDLGEHRLKGLTRPERIYQLVVPDLPDAFPPLRTLEPEPITVAGREQELAEAARVAIAERPRRLGRVRWRLVAVGALVLAAAVAAALVEVTGGSRSPPVVATPNTLGVIDPKANTMVDVVEVGDTPTSVALGGNAVWVLNANEQTVSKVDAHTRAVLTQVPAGTAPSDLAVGAGAIWVASSAFTLTKIDPDSGAVLRSIQLPRSSNPLQGASASWVAADRREVWATGKSTVSRVSPRPLRVDLRNVSCCEGAALGDGSVWLADDAGVLRISARTGATEDQVPLSFAASDVAFGAGTVWVTDPRGNKVWAIDPRTNRLEGSVSVGDNPQGVAVGEGAAWVASADGTVSRIDPRSLRLVKQIRVGGTPAGIAAGDGAIWVSVN